ncbi:MAG TPA: S9 family peptidase [Candidatus Acidoferrales bacterium]|nr:S9 family peptidase [Candidatus Acidoferrales bacterium]
MNRSLSAGALLVLSTLATPILGQDPPKASAPKLLTPEDSLNLRTISDVQFSPDGNRLAFVVTEPSKGERRARHIWLYEKQSGSLRQFTYSAKSDFWPRWSPDGKQLAFLSDRDEQQQIYAMHANSGEASALTKGKRGVQNFAWSPDGKQIAFLAPDAKTEAEEKKEKDKDDARVADKDDKHARLWLLTIDTGEAKALTEPKWKISQAVWHPSGSGLMLSATDHPESDQNTERIFFFRLWDAVNGNRKAVNSMTQVLAPRGPFANIRVAADGLRMAFVGCREDGPTPHDLMLAHHGDKAAQNLTGASIDRPVFDYRWSRDGGLLAVVGDGFHTKFIAFTAEGALKDVAAIPANPNAFGVFDSGEVAFAGQTATTPQELWLWDQKSAPKQISHLNESWKQYTLSAPEFYKYKSFDGLEIEAALLKPPGYDGKSKLPLIAVIHGGPTGAWQDSIETWGQLLAARGYAIFYPNIRGSSGYGEKFIEMNRGDWGGGDYRDVMAGVDDLIARGIADPEKLAIGGWSYGGYMSEWAITQTTRFKAAVSGAGLSNLISEYGTEEGPAYDEWFYGAPYEPDKVAGFLNSSPFVHLKNVKTPTLILQGDADPVDPPGQSQELYRGLKRYGVETELVVYPREPHGFHEERHLLDRLNRILAWYDKHLKEASPTTR